MAWVKLDDQFFRHRKARAAGKDGRALFLASCCYAAAGLSDGFIPSGDLVLIAAEAEVRATVANTLRDVGLWDVVDGGWMIHDFTDINPTAEEVKERRRQARERQDGWRQRKNASRNASRDAVSNGVTNAPPSRPDPEGVKGRVSEESSALAVAPAAEGGATTALDEETVQRNVTAARAARRALKDQQ